MVADTKPSPYWKEEGIPITGLKDSANGPTCGACAGILLTKQYPVDGTQCPVCRRIWYANRQFHLDRQKIIASQAYKVKCILCNEHWLEGEGHICPTLPTPRRREAIDATKKKL